MPTKRAEELTPGDWATVKVLIVMAKGLTVWDGGTQAGVQRLREAACNAEAVLGELVF